jgi:hypothetical protein
LAIAILSDNFNKEKEKIENNKFKKPIQNEYLKIFKRLFKEKIPKKRIRVDKIKKTFPEICIEMINNMEKELEEDSKDIYHYESKIFPYSREKIWEIITNFHCLMSQQGIITNCNIQTPIVKEGTEISFFVPAKNKLCRLKINKFKNDAKNKKWVLGSLPLCGPFAHSENYWTLVQLGENETLATNTSKYIEHIDSEIIKKLSDEKINTFQTIENMLKEKYKDNNKKNEDEKKK